MKKERTLAPVTRCELNTGQLEWLPKNPREWTAEDVEKTRRSIVEDRDFLEDRPLLAVEHDGKLVVFAGNLRLTGVKKTDIKAVPVVVYTPESDEDLTTIKRRAMKDNGSFGKWDFDMLANEWDDLPLEDWGIPAWKDERQVLSPDQYGEDFELPSDEKQPFQKISFQLSNEMAEVLKLAIKSAQYTEDFYDIEGDDKDKNGNGVAAYIIAKYWCDNLNVDFGGVTYEDAAKGVEELREYLRGSLKEAGIKPVDVDRHLGTNGMSGHYFGASQWLFPSRYAYEKMREIMPLPRDYFECKKVELRYNLIKTLQDYKKNGTR